MLPHDISNIQNVSIFRTYQTILSCKNYLQKQKITSCNVETSKLSDVHNIPTLISVGHPFF